MSNKIFNLASVARFSLTAAVALSLGAALAGTAVAQPAAPSAAAAAGLVPGAGTSTLGLLLKHEQVSVEADGIRRQVNFTEQVYRYPDTVFVRRVIPEGAHDAHEHAKMAKPHKHHDLSAASRWIVREPGDQLRVRLIQNEDRVVIDVPKADWGNVGFDGSWPTAWHLLSPEQLGRLAASGRSAPAGARWYAGGQGGRKVAVLWDIEGAFPRIVEVEANGGRYRSRMQAERIAMPARKPWEAAAGYKSKDYSDMLD